MSYIKPLSRLHAEFAKQSGRVRIRCTAAYRSWEEIWTKWKDVELNSTTIFNDYEDILESTLRGEMWSWCDGFKYEIVIWEGDLEYEKESAT